MHTVLDNLSRQLHKDEIGTSKVQARIVTIAEEEQLWASGAIGTETPEALQNTVFFYRGIYLCLRGGEEHRQLKLSQFKVEEVENPHDALETVRCLTYTEHGSKNRPGSLYQVHLANKVVQHYANSSLGNCCFVQLVTLYISKLPEKATEKDVFYCKPAKNVVVGKPWYFETPVGHNILKKKLKDIFALAGLDNSNISNHSLRATSVTRLFEKGVPEKIIMEHSGHLSMSGVRSYEHTSEYQKKTVSDVLSSSSISFDGDRKPLSDIVNAETSVKKETTSEPPKDDSYLTTISPSSDDPSNKENASSKVSEVMKHFTFGNVDGCTFNFNFN